MKLKGVFKRTISLFLTLCIMFSLINVLSFNVFASDKYNAVFEPGSETEGSSIWFQSGTDDVNSGLVVTPLGYFCSAYDKSTDLLIGTVFMYKAINGVVNGRCYYNSNNSPEIPVADINAKFTYEYGSGSTIITNYNRALASGNLVYVLDTLLTIGYKEDSNITHPCIRIVERGGHLITANEMYTELADFSATLGYTVSGSTGGDSYSHQYLASNSFKDDATAAYNKTSGYRYLSVYKNGFQACIDNTSTGISTYLQNQAWEKRGAVLYISSDFVSTSDAASRCGVTPTYSRVLYSKFPRLDPCPSTTSFSVVSSCFTSYAQTYINDGFFAVGISNPEKLKIDVDVEALAPTFHTNATSTTAITSPKEGDPLYIKYHFKNNSNADLNCNISGTFAPAADSGAGSFATKTVTIGAGNTYVETVGPIYLDRSDFGDERDNYWFYKEDTKEAYNALFEVQATGSISLDGSVYIDSDTSNNTAINQYAIHIKAPSVTNDNITYNGYPEISTKMYSGQPIKPKIRFKNNSTFSGLFAESVQMLFGGNLISDYNYFNNKSEYITPYNDWTYSFSGYYRPKFTDASSTGTLTIRSSAYEQSAYEYWGTRGWDQSTHVGSATKEITVYPADLEILGLKFLVGEKIDGRDTIVERDELYVGQTAFAELTVANNSAVPVFVKFSLSADKNYSQTLTLPAKTRANIRSNGFIVGSQNTTSTISGAIYMADLWEDASYEYNQDNNTATKTVPVITPFKPQAAGGLTQDSVSYRRGTDVFTSFYIENTSFNDVHTPMPTASITVYGDSALTDIIYKEDVPFCVPAKETTMTWVKWTVPHDCPDTVYIKIICDKDNTHSGAGFTDNGKNSKSLLVTANVAMPIDVSTPDTTFVKEAPYWYKSATDFSVSQNSSLKCFAIFSVLILNNNSFCRAFNIT